MSLIENKPSIHLLNNEFNNLCITCCTELDETEKFSIHQFLPQTSPPITFFEAIKQLIANFAQLSVNQVPQNACHSCLINTVGFLRFQTVCHKAVDTIKSFNDQQAGTSSTLLVQCPTSSILDATDKSPNDENLDAFQTEYSDHETEPKEQSVKIEHDQQNEEVESGKEDDFDCNKLIKQCPPSLMVHDGLADKDLDTSDEDSNDIDDEESGAKQSEDEEFVPKKYNTRRSNEKGEYQCTVCGKTFSTQGTLKIHAVVHKDELDHVCPECGKGFKGEQHLKTHINRMHRERPPKTCEICGEVFMNADGYSVHKVKAHGTEHECNVCGKKFFNINHLKRHIDSHTGIQRFECTFCGKKFRHKHGKKIHEASYCKARTAETRVVAESETTQPSTGTESAQEEQDENEESTAQEGEGEQQGARPYLCSVCGKTFCKKTNLNIHIVVHNDTLDYTCPEPECGRKFKGKRHLNYHIKSVHRETPTKICEICGQVFTNDDAYSAYDRHKLKMHGKQHECVHCGKSFFNISHLKRHIESHIGIQRFECAFCGKKFRQKHGKLEHEARYCKVRKTETPINQEEKSDDIFTDEIEKRRARKKVTNLAWGKKIVSCQFCQKSVRRDQLRAHEGLHREDKPFACTVCGRTFKLRSAHHAHIQLHKDTLDYLCSECGKGFKSSMHLGTHRRTVHNKRITKTCEICGKVSTNAATHNLHMEMHGEKKFECELCDKKFYHISSLKRHSTTHTGIKPFECTYCSTQFEHKQSFERHVAGRCKVLKSGALINTDADVDDVPLT